jgi:hypothetical protein
MGISLCSPALSKHSFLKAGQHSGCHIAVQIQYIVISSGPGIKLFGMLQRTHAEITPPKWFSLGFQKAGCGLDHGQISYETTSLSNGLDHILFVVNGATGDVAQGLPPISVSIFAHDIGPAYYHCVTGTKTVALIAFHNAVKNKVVASAALRPIFKVVKFRSKTVSPSAPTIVGKTATKGKQSRHAAFLTENDPCALLAPAPRWADITLALIKSTVALPKLRRRAK